MAKARTRSPEIMPHGSWPLEMRAETAAAYCDEPSVDAFRAKVERGIYCQPRREKGCLPKWFKPKLDQDLARRHGTMAEVAPVRKNLENLI